MLFRSCLRWLQQKGERQQHAVMLKDDVLRLSEIPLVITMPGVRHPRGTHLKVEIIGWDEVDLSVQARVLEVSTAAVTADEALELEEVDLIADTADEAEHSAEQQAAAQDMQRVELATIQNDATPDHSVSSDAPD